MKDRTNKEKPDLKQTIESIGMMYQSLESLLERIYPQSPLWFAIMAQGTVDQIRDLLDDVDCLMEDMIPREMCEQAVQLEESEEAEAVATREAA